MTGLSLRTHTKLGLTSGCPGGRLNSGRICTGSWGRRGPLHQLPGLWKADLSFGFNGNNFFFFLPHRTIPRCGHMVPLTVGTFFRELTVSAASAVVLAMTKLLAVKTPERIRNIKAYINFQVSNRQLLWRSGPVKREEIICYVPVCIDLPSFLMVNLLTSDTPCSLNSSNISSSGVSSRYLVRMTPLLELRVR